MEEAQGGHRSREEASISLSDSHDNHFKQSLSAQICEVKRNGPGSLALILYQPLTLTPEDDHSSKPLSGQPLFTPSP